MVSTSTIVTCISHIIWSVCDILTSAQLLVSWWLVKCKSRLLLMNEWHILLRVPCISHWNCWFELWSCKCLHLVNGKWGGKLFQRKAIVHNTTCCSSKDLREVHKVSQYDPYKFFRGRQKKKMLFRWQLTKLNLSAHSNASGQDYTSGHGMKGFHLVHWRQVAPVGAGELLGVRAVVTAQETPFPLSWVSPHSNTLTEWNKGDFFFPGPHMAGAGLKA